MKAVRLVISSFKQNERFDLSTVYWGANHATDHVFVDCCIDCRRPRDTEDVYKLLKSMSAAELRQHQLGITEFLQSDGLYPFRTEFFAETIVNTIVQGIGSQA